MLCKTPFVVPAGLTWPVESSRCPMFRARDAPLYWLRCWRRWTRGSPMRPCSRWSRPTWGGAARPPRRQAPLDAGGGGRSGRPPGPRGVLRLPLACLPAGCPVARAPGGRDGPAASQAPERVGAGAPWPLPASVSRPPASPVSRGGDQPAKGRKENRDTTKYLDTMFCVKFALLLIPLRRG